MSDTKTLSGTSLLRYQFFCHRMHDNSQHVIRLRILKHSVATNPRAVARRAVAIIVVAAIVVVVVVGVAVITHCAFAIIVDFVARRAIASVVVVGPHHHRVALLPVVPSSAYVLLTCMFVHCPYMTLYFSIYSS